MIGKCIHDAYMYMLYMFCAPIILREGRKGTLEHLARDEVAIARQVGSIFIWEILLKWCTLACIDWWLASLWELIMTLKFYAHLHSDTWWHDIYWVELINSWIMNLVYNYGVVDYSSWCHHVIGSYILFIVSQACWALWLIWSS